MGNTNSKPSLFEEDYLLRKLGQVALAEYTPKPLDVVLTSA